MRTILSSAATAALLAMATAPAALAAPGTFVEQWSWEATGMFVEWTDSRGNVGPASDFIFTDPQGAATSTAIGWGGGSNCTATSTSCSPTAPTTNFLTDRMNYASMQLEAGMNDGSNNIATDGAAQSVLELGFTNTNVAASSVILDAAAIEITFELNSALPDNLGLADQGVMRSINLEFVELTIDDVLGSGSSLECAGGAGLCEDVLIVQDPMAQSFEFNGVDYLYDVTFDASAGLTALDEDECVFFGAAADCLGFYVAEGAVLDGSFGLNITSGTMGPIVNVAEPASLALLGLGLIGVGALRRCK